MLKFVNGLIIGLIAGLVIGIALQVRAVNMSASVESNEVNACVEILKINGYLK